MLIVKTKLKEFKDKGIGLLADEDIKKGQKIWKYHHIVDVNLLKEQVPIKAKEFFEKYAVDRGDGNYFLSIDNSRFINHSKNPNTKSLGNFKDNMAVRDIKKGEEITIDYEHIDVNEVDF